MKLSKFKSQIFNKNKIDKIIKKLISYILSILIKFSIVIIIPIILSIIATFFLFRANAEQIKTMSGDDQASIVISKTDLNRIKLINDKIKSLKYNQGELIITQDNNLGEVYIRASNFHKKNINLFITSQKGYVYKLLLTLKNIPSEQIFIKNNRAYYANNLNKDSFDENFDNGFPIDIKFEDSYQSSIIDLIKYMTDRDSIASFYIVDRGGHRVRFKKGLKIKWETSYISNYRNRNNNISNLSGEIFSVKNITNKVINLQEQDFLRKGIIAVKLDTLKLNPNEITSLYLVGGTK